jgi:hypothetical protein
MQELEPAREYPDANRNINWIRLVTFLHGHHFGWFVTLLFIIAAQPLAFWLCRLVIRRFF